jgi:hypothetical protein
MPASSPSVSRNGRRQTGARGLVTLDWAVIIIYLVAITAVGLIAGRRVRKTGEFFLGGASSDRG